MRELVGGSNVQQMMRRALSGNRARSRRIGQCLGPRGDVCMVSLGVHLELLAKVCVEGSKAVLTAKC